MKILQKKIQNAYMDIAFINHGERVQDILLFDFLMINLLHCPCDRLGSILHDMLPLFKMFKIKLGVTISMTVWKNRISPSNNLYTLHEIHL